MSSEFREDININPKELFNNYVLVLFVGAIVLSLILSFKTPFIALGLFTVSVIILHVQMLLTWNKKLREKKFVSAKVPLGVVAGILLLFIACFGILTNHIIENDLLFSFFASLLVSLFYAWVLLRFVIYYKIGYKDNPVIWDTDPYTGEITAYLTQRDYVNRVEEVALKKKDE